ncbi:MAG: hypothetical protein OWU33_02630 [Firmicutes bacterium]|nr:hypothetical protein [Bacillota bacterium]
MFRERVDRRIEKMLERLIEPHIEEWLHRFFRSDDGEALISDIVADFLLSWLMPGTARPGYFQQTLVAVVRQLATTDPEFRQAIVDALNPHWAHGRPSDSSDTEG